MISGKKYFFYIMIIFCCHILFCNLLQAKKVALVIGNADYNIRPLKNPVNDSNDISVALQRLNFEVILKQNLNKRDFKLSIREFTNKLRHNDIALLYYSGHGLQQEGKNFLIPTNADIKSLADIEFESIDLQYALALMKQSRSSINIIILDACRDNPFSVGSKGIKRVGLARVNCPTGTLIAYATSPGKVAEDGFGRNGTYTKHLLKVLQSNPNQSISDLFVEVGAKVIQETNGSQAPWQSMSLTGKFCLSDCMLNRSDKTKENDLKKNHALLIGIGAFNGRAGLQSFEGPKNDVLAIKNLLMNKYGFIEKNILTVVDKEGTKKNILKSFRKLMETTGSGDNIFIFLTGCGVNTNSSFNIGSCESAFVPIDIDDDIQDTKNIHSLILGRDIMPILKYLDSDRNILFIADMNNGQYMAGVNNKCRYVYNNTVFISATKTDQETMEVFKGHLDDNAHGIFGYSLIHILRSKKGPIKYDEFINSLKLFGNAVINSMDKLKSSMPNEFTPVIFGSQHIDKEVGISFLKAKND